MPVSAPTKVKRSKKAEQRAEMMEQILDAAEHLFSKHGLYGVTLKDVAQRVGVHHTLMNYYFTDKQKLFDAVFARRATVTSKRRMDALDAYEGACAGKPTVEGALRAFLDTDLELYGDGGEGWRNYGKLSAQAANMPYGAALFDEHFDRVVLKLIGLLKQALPDCPEEDIFWGYHFVSGGLMLTLARSGRLDRLSNGLCQSDDFDAAKDRMASFMAGGFVSVCERRMEERKQSAKAPVKRTRKS
jgi:AcrR family transcriptional regulator